VDFWIESVVSWLGFQQSPLKRPDLKVRATRYSIILLPSTLKNYLYHP
jgi:hypothetical protein